MIVRGAHRPDGWVAIPNQTVRDTRLSLTAIGLLCHLLSHEPGWRVNCDQISRTFSIGRDRTRKAMNELIEHGYALRTKHQTTAGHWITDTVIYDQPVNRTVDELWTSQQPTPENPYVGISGANRRTSKNDDGLGFIPSDTLNECFG